MEAWPGALKKHVFLLFWRCFLCAVLVLCLSLSCLPRGAPGRHANIENSFTNNVFTMNLLGWPFCAKCKENKFQSTGTRKTTRKNTCKNSPRDVSTNHQQKVHFGSQNGAQISSTSLPEACRRPLAPQDAPKSSKRDQKDPKSGPRALQERREAIFRATTFPDGGSAGLEPDRLGLAP